MSTPQNPEEAQAEKQFVAALAALPEEQRDGAMQLAFAGRSTWRDRLAALQNVKELLPPQDAPAKEPDPKTFRPKDAPPWQFKRQDAEGQK